MVVVVGCNEHFEAAVKRSNYLDCNTPTDVVSLITGNVVIALHATMFTISVRVGFMYGLVKRQTTELE